MGEGRIKNATNCFQRLRRLSGLNGEGRDRHPLRLQTFGNIFPEGVGHRLIDNHERATVLGNRNFPPNPRPYHHPG